MGLICLFILHCSSFSGEKSVNVD